MKKSISFLAVVLILLCCIGAAMAAEVTASYEDGKLTVTTTTNGWYRILVDGVGTGFAVTPRLPSYTFEWPLTPGEHTITLSSDTDGWGSTTVYVAADPNNPIDIPTATPATPTPAPTIEPAADPTARPTDEPNEKPTETPTAKPTAQPTSQPLTEIQPQSDINLDQYRALIPKTASIEPTCTEDGKAADGTKLSPLGHQFIYKGKTSDNVVMYVCNRCGISLNVNAFSPVNNRLGSIVVAKDGKPLDYKGYSTQSDASLYTIETAPEKGGAVLMLDGQIIRQLIREGYSRLAFICNGDCLTITLNEISTRWFSTDRAVMKYLFVIDPDGTSGTEYLALGVTAESLLAAANVSGITLK